MTDIAKLTADRGTRRLTPSDALPGRSNMFEHILKWRLLVGSHDFPGPDGGTCIVEAALVVAGLPYRKIDDPKDFPPCFCPVLATYALRLNDTMPADVRQRLIPFVPRLAGSADSDHELARTELIIQRTKHEIGIDIFWTHHRGQHELMLKAVAQAGDVEISAQTLGPLVWDTALSILGNAFQIGRKAAPIELSLIRARVDEIKRVALQRASSLRAKAVSPA